MSAGTKRSICPVASTLDQIGDKWSLLIVRDLLAGKSHFQELARSPEGIASNILAARLERLQRAGVVAATPSSKRSGSVAYELTRRGRDLLPVLEAMKVWGLAHIRGTAVRIEPIDDLRRRGARS
jgi:DNA-binding HxlR family transcriptional regulator